MDLRYRPKEPIEELAIGECELRQTERGGILWWELWFNVLRDTDGVAEVFAVPVIPNGAYAEDGPGGRSWGLNKTADGVWQVSASINVIDVGNEKIIVSGPHYLPSLWHQTPALVGVPDGEPWQHA